MENVSNFSIFLYPNSDLIIPRVLLFDYFNTLYRGNGSLLNDSYE